MLYTLYRVNGKDKLLIGNVTNVSAAKYKIAWDKLKCLISRQSVTDYHLYNYSGHHAYHGVNIWGCSLIRIFCEWSWRKMDFVGCANIYRFMNRDDKIDVKQFLRAWFFHEICFGNDGPGIYKSKVIMKRYRAHRLDLDIEKELIRLAPLVLSGLGSIDIDYMNYVA